MPRRRTTLSLNTKRCLFFPHEDLHLLLVLTCIRERLRRISILLQNGNRSTIAAFLPAAASWLRRLATKAINARPTCSWAALAASSCAVAPQQALFGLGPARGDPLVQALELGVDLLLVLPIVGGQLRKACALQVRSTSGRDTLDRLFRARPPTLGVFCTLMTDWSWLSRVASVGRKL